MRIYIVIRSWKLVLSPNSHFFGSLTAVNACSLAPHDTVILLQIVMVSPGTYLVKNCESQSRTKSKYLNVVQLYKIIYGYSDTDYMTYVDLTGPTRTRSNHDFKIRPRAATTNYFKFSFFNRYVNDRNSLPNSVMSASSLNSFKILILNYLCK